MQADVIDEIVAILAAQHRDWPRAGREVRPHPKAEAYARVLRWDVRGMRAKRGRPNTSCTSLRARTARSFVKTLKGAQPNG